MSVSGEEDRLPEEPPAGPSDPKPPSTGPPVASRRPHRKSRRGCVQCKQRRIKCDEGKPSCAKCIHYSTTCSFLQLQPASTPKSTYDSSQSSTEPHSHNSIPTSGPSATLAYQPEPQRQHPSSFSSPSSQGPPSNFSISDLELFLNFSTTTYLTVPPVELWPIAVPALAFKYAFIAHELIALSALHIAYLEPPRRNEMLREARRHHEIALTGFQEILHDINEFTYHPSTMGASLITVYAFASRTGNLFLHDSSDAEADPGDIELVQLLRGQRVIMRSGRRWLSSGPMWRHAKPWMERNQAEAPSEEDAGHLAVVQPLFAPTISTEASALNSTFNVLRTMFAVMNNDNGISDAEGALGMLTHITPEYLNLVQSHNPQALILLAHYCILLKRADSYWWLEGSAERLMGSIKRVLPLDWHGWIEWPLKEVNLGGDGARKASI